MVWEDEQEERKEAKDKPVKNDSDDNDEGDMDSMEEGGKEITRKVSSNMNDDSKRQVEEADALCWEQG